MKIRVCNLEAGELFQHMGTAYRVMRVDETGIYYKGYSFVTNQACSEMQRFGNNCQMKVLLIVNY